MTHSREAQYLGVYVPELKKHVSLLGEIKPQLFSNPVTADTLKDLDILSYFREDYDFNDHHYHWHLVYPPGGIKGADDKMHRVIDRQGELFLYMHSQMIARYKAELLSWGLDMGYPWGYEDIVQFGYTPTPLLRKIYGDRPPFKGWYEVHNPNISKDDADSFPPKKKLMMWRDNIHQAITDGVLHTKKKDGNPGTLKLTKDNAMNWIGIAVEAESKELQEVSPGSGELLDCDMYGNLHNLGHNKFAEIGYSDKNPLGVMADNYSSPRDPVFWLWHRHIDDFHLAVMKKYSHDLKEFMPKAKIISLNIVPEDSDSSTLLGGITTYLSQPSPEDNEVHAKLAMSLTSGSW